MSTFHFSLQGNLAADPAFGVTEAGREYANLTVIRTDRYQRNGQWEDGRTLAVRLTFWGTSTKTIESLGLGRGDRVMVEVGSDLHLRVHDGKPYAVAAGRTIALLAKRARPAADQAGAHDVVPTTGAYATLADTTAA